jgi:hypothetical protein
MIPPRLDGTGTVPGPVDDTGTGTTCASHEHQAANTDCQLPVTEIPMIPPQLGGAGTGTGPGPVDDSGTGTTSASHEHQLANTGKFYML